MQTFHTSAHVPVLFGVFQGLVTRVWSTWFAGMHLARNQADPDYRTRGAFGGPHMVALTSEHAHYSYLKAAFLTGTTLSLEHCNRKPV